MLGKLPIVAATVLLAAGQGFAWNRAGHMVTGAIAFDELLRTRPASIAAVVSILREHPQYESRWKPQLSGLNKEDQERMLFMLAARWPDDIRGDQAFDHPAWHFIDYPYKPKGQPDSVRAPPPAADNLVEAFRQNVALARSAATNAEKAVALCWIFHLMGDSHQPLHTVSLFTTQFPDGDRGGNLFFVRPAPTSATQNLHAYWDGILLADDRYDPARALAANLQKDRGPAPFRSPAESQIEEWTRHSFDLAVSRVYRRGKLKISTDRNAGTLLPRDYHAVAEQVARRQAALASYRLAGLLRSSFP